MEKVVSNNYNTEITEQGKNDRQNVYKAQDHYFTTAL